MAAVSPFLRQGVALGVNVAVVELVDRRQDASGEAKEWAFQREVEAVLYGNGYAQQTGAVYRLLQRSGVVRDSLALKKACIQQGIVTQHEFDSMRAHLGDVRSFTLIPLAALRTALSVFGCDAKSEALVAALDIDRPDDWPESEAEAEEAEEAEGGADEEDEDGDGGAESAHEDGMDEGGDHGDSGGSDAVSIAGTEVVEEHTIVGDDANEAVDEATPFSQSAKRQHVELKPITITPKLEAELAAFDTHRGAMINQARKGVSVAPTTREKDRSYILRFFAWLVDKGLLKREPTLAIFAHTYIGTAVERYTKELVDEHKRTWSYTARVLSSFVAAVHFVISQRGGQDANGAVTKLEALHAQSGQQARIESKFSLAEKPSGFLEWEAVQRVRVAAEAALLSAKTDATKLKCVRDVTVLRLLALCWRCAILASLFALELLPRLACAARHSQRGPEGPSVDSQSGS